MPFPQSQPVDPAAAEDRRPEVIERLQNLSTTLQSLEAVVTGLTKRLSVVMTPELKSDEEGTAEKACVPPCSQVSAMVEEQTKRVIFLTHTLHEAVERLEV